MKAYVEFWAMLVSSGDKDLKDVPRKWLDLVAEELSK